MKNHKEEKLRKIPPKNYIYLGLILLASTLIIIYIYNFVDTYNQNKLNVSIMNNYLTVINYNELDDYLMENKNAILYVSILGDKEINKFEQKFKNTVLANNLRNNILYLDITKENQESAKQKLKINNNFPHFVIYTNGEITDTFSIDENNFDTKKILKYLNRIGAIESD